MSERSFVTSHGTRPVSAPSLSTRLDTDRLVLRPPRSSDVGRLRDALRRNAEHLAPWIASPVPGDDPTSLTAVARTIARERAEWKSGQTFAMVILQRDDETRIMGRIALGGVHRGAFQNAYLGYWIDAQHQGRGLMTEAVIAVTGFAFARAKLHRIQAAVTPSNRTSRRVVEKAGYRQEGLAQRYLCIAGHWDDHLIYAVTAEEWPTRANG